MAETSITTKICSDVEYDDFLKAIQKRFEERVKSGTPLFTTAITEDLFGMFLMGIPEGRRQHYTCRTCQRFFDEVGGLVIIDDDYQIEPAFWCVDDAPSELKNAVHQVISLVKHSRVTGVYLSEEKVVGKPLTKIQCFDAAAQGFVTEEWHHLSVSLKEFHSSVLETASQAMAGKLENFNTVRNTLTCYKQEYVERAVQLLKSGKLPRSEKVLSQAEWLLKLHRDFYDAKGDAKDRLVWKAVATAPEGFCHPRSSMLGSLLEDIKKNLEGNLIVRRFGEKMDPLQYQRPTAPPSDGVIAQAEKVFEKLKAAGSLERRFCRLDEVVKLWSPKQKETKSDGLFGHLRTKRKIAEVSVGSRTPITWEKFQRTVLPTAEKIEVFLPNAPLPLGALLTAVNPEAPPILQWDSEGRRNSVSWYVYRQGAWPNNFNLEASKWHVIECITRKPPHWYDESEFSHFAQGVMLLIEGAKEAASPSLGLFPEILRSEFHGIRRVIESHSNSKAVSKSDEPHACGLILDSGSSWSTPVRVTSGGLTTEYTLDRWD